MYQVQALQAPVVQTASLLHGGDVDKMQAVSWRGNFIESRAAGTLNAAQCPEAVVFNLDRLKSFLEKVEEVYNRLNIPVTDRGIAVMPMLYEKDGMMNMMFTPCIKDAQGNIVHTFTVTAENGDTPGGDDWWELLWESIWNHGSGIF